MDDSNAIKLFKTLLQFRTVSAEGPKGAYQECVAFLETECSKVGMETKVVEPISGKPILIATKVGLEPELPSLVFNSHYDVVPVMEEHWNTDAFAAVEKDGRIFGRGTQDMKCVCAQYILAMARQVEALRRTVHFTFVPDEEIGGAEGMKAFIDTGLFKSILGNVGVAFDEGLANPLNKFTTFYGERAPLWLNIKSKGPTGHGSRFIADTAVEKLLAFTSKAIAFRKVQEKKLGYPENGNCKHCEAVKLGDVTTVNITMLQAGVSADNGKTYSLNVIPVEAKAGMDMRVPPTVPLSEIRAMLDDWTAAEGLSWEFAGPEISEHYVTSIEDQDKNTWWRLFSGSIKSMGHEIVPEIFPAGTDSRFLRELGLPAFGFSPMK